MSLIKTGEGGSLGFLPQDLSQILSVFVTNVDAF